jgi:hypothetical protein
MRSRARRARHPPARNAHALRPSRAPPASAAQTLNKRVKVIREIISEVAGLAPYEKRVLDVIKVRPCRRLRGAGARIATRCAATSAVRDLQHSLAVVPRTDDARVAMVAAAAPRSRYSARTLSLRGRRQTHACLPPRHARPSLRASSPADGRGECGEAVV